MDHPLCNQSSCICINCLYNGKSAKGVVVTLIGKDGLPIDRQKANKEGKAFFSTHATGEVILRAWSPFASSLPRAIYCRVCLQPGSCISLKFIFKRNVPRGMGGIRIKLRDTFYRYVPLEGGVYQLWQMF